MRLSNWFAATCGLLALGARAIDVKDVKVVVTTATGGSDRTYNLESGRPLEKVVELEIDSILRLTFTSKPAPKYAHAEFQDVVTGSRWTYEVPIKAGGKARLDLKASALPTPLRKSSGTLTLSLSLSSPTSPSYSASLLTMTIPAKRLLPPSPHRHALTNKNERDPAFTLQDEIQWTFGTGEKPVNVVVSLIGALVVLAQAGWLLQGAFSIVSNKGGDRASGNGNLFLGTLIGLELLTVKYWVNGRIYTFLPPFLALALVSAYIGKNALRDIQLKRVSAQLRA